MQSSRKKHRAPALTDALKWAEQRKSPTDPDGTWTGVPLDPDDEPVQDADDL